MQFQENGKTYEIEDGRVVAAYETPAPEAKQASVDPETFDFGDRVAYREETGSVISIVPSIYGETIGVKFDDGGLGEFISSQLTKIEGEKPAYSSAIDEFAAEYAEYSEIEANTLKEVEKKRGLARSLNKRAKSLLSQSDLSLSDRIRLDEIVTATYVDNADLEESFNLLREAENASYLDSRPKFKMESEFHSTGTVPGVSSKGDSSWLAHIDPEIVDETDWDGRLADLAKQAVSSLTHEQLNDTDFMKHVRSFTYQGLPEERQARFATYLENAAELKLAEPELTVKEASVEDFSDVIDEALFM